MKQVELMTGTMVRFCKSYSTFLLTMLLVFVILPAFGQGPEDLSEVEAEVEDAWDSLKNIISIFYVASLVIGGGYVIWAFSSKKQDATNYLIFWVIGLVVYFILRALFF